MRGRRLCLVVALCVLWCGAATAANGLDGVRCLERDAAGAQAEVVGKFSSLLSSLDAAATGVTSALPAAARGARAAAGAALRAAEAAAEAARVTTERASGVLIGARENANVKTKGKGPNRHVRELMVKERLWGEIFQKMYVQLRTTAEVFDLTGAAQDATEMAKEQTETNAKLLFFSFKDTSSCPTSYQGADVVAAKVNELLTTSKNELSKAAQKVKELISAAQIVENEINNALRENTTENMKAGARRKGLEAEDEDAASINDSLWVFYLTTFLWLLFCARLLPPRL